MGVSAGFHLADGLAEFAIAAGLDAAPARIQRSLLRSTLLRR